MLKKMLAASLAAVLVFGLVSCGKKEEDKDKDKDPEKGQSYTAADIVAESENFQFSRAEFSYLFYQNYNDFRQYNQSYMQHFGFDTNASLKEQSYSEELTWFEYFAQPSVEYLRQLLVLCEGARAAGIELDDEDYTEIDIAFDSYKSYAEDYEYDLQEFLTELFGSDVTSESMRSYLEKSKLAFKYRDMIVEKYDFSDEEIDAYLNDNTDKFYYIDYLTYTFNENTDDGAAASAEALSAVTDAASFEAYVRKYETETLKKSKDEMDLSGMTNEYVLKDANNPFSVWAFDGAQAGTTYVDKNEVDGIYNVYLLTKAPYLQDYVTKSFRYVYMTLDTYSTYDKALARANELVDTWRAGDADAHSFGELAFNYSEDRATCYTGGLQENLGKAPSKFPDSVVDWLYDPARQAGDIEVIKGENAYFIVYFEGDGKVQWKDDAQSALVEEKFVSDTEKLSETYETKVYEEVVDSLSA